jgi:hypothetical protein
VRANLHKRATVCGCRPVRLLDGEESG